jgi:hypothetical protein
VLSLLIGGTVVLVLLIMLLVALVMTSERGDRR